jgi:hypothetical protein
MRWLAVAAVCLACKGKQAPPRQEDARVRPIDAAIPDAAIDAARPDAATMSTTITADGVGPITAKATSERHFRKLLPGFVIASQRHEAEDYKYDEITARKDGKRALRAVVSDDSLFKVEVEHAIFATAAGVTVGMTVGDAAEKIMDLACVFETYDPEADAERVDRSLRCASKTLPHVLFEIDLDKLDVPEGTVPTKTIAKRRIVQIVWLASDP